MAIERSCAEGGDPALKATAQKYTLSFSALSKHMADHRAPAPAVADRSPKPDRRRRRAPLPPPKLERALAVVADDDDADEDDAPATARSSDLRKTSARGELDEVLHEIRTLLEEARREDYVVGIDDEGKPLCARRPIAERATVLRTALSSIRLLGNLTGELGASESAIVTSAHWKRFEGELLEILKGHPAALKDVVGWLEKKQEAA